MTVITRYCGCLPCLLMGLKDVHATIEHVTENGRRIGGEEQHQWTIGLCEWHHFGVPWEGMTVAGLQKQLGPSLALGRTVFEEAFGDEVKVLVPVQNFLLDQFATDPWPTYNLPRQVANKTRRHWIELKHATTT